MLDAPQVLLEQSFLRALTDADHPEHARAAAGYLSLVDQFERKEVLLVAVSDHLGEFRGWRHLGPLAPLDRLWVGLQHRRAARRLVTDTTLEHDTTLDHDIALTLVMCERHRVRRMATLDPTFGQFDLELLPLSDG